MAKRAIIVINGKGEIGKDTLISALEQTGAEVSNVSSIDPIKDMCVELNKTGEKDLAYRNLLSRVKKAVDDYCEAKEGVSYTTGWLIEQMKFWCEILSGRATKSGADCDVMFVHIREPENIKKFLDAANRTLCLMRDEDTILTTLLVKSDRALEIYGNSSDDDVERFGYDRTFTANGTIEEDSARFVKLVREEILGLKEG